MKINKTSIFCALTCHDCPWITFGTSSGTVGAINVTVVCCGGSQAVHLSTQGCEGLVVFSCGKTKQLLHKQDVAVRPDHAGPLEPYGWTRNSFGKGDLRCGRHCGNVRWRIQHYSTEELLPFYVNVTFLNSVFTCHGHFNFCAHDSVKLKDLQCDLIGMSGS